MIQLIKRRGASSKRSREDIDKLKSTVVSTKEKNVDFEPKIPELAPL